MSEEADWQSRLRDAELACRKALSEPVLAAVSGQIRGALAEPGGSFSELSTLTDHVESANRLKVHSDRIRAGPHVFERWLLLQSCLTAASAVATAPLYDGVKTLWADEAMFCVRAPEVWRSTAFSFDHIRFRELAKIVTLRRFPAGQFHWELSGLPRSYALRTPARKWPHLLACVLELRGFGPLAETHLNARRRNRLTMTEAEGVRSYYLMARSLEQQPEVKGLFAASWLYCESTARVSPQLLWLRKFLEDHGAFLGSAGFAPENSGFMTGSDERRTLYEGGKYHPRIGYAVWPRREMLQWAKQFGNK